MPRELKVIEYCDVCLTEEGAKVDAVYSDTITIGGATRDLMLCGPHREQIIGDFAELLVKYGVRPATNGEPSAVISADIPPCPICRKIGITTKTGLKGHMFGQHGADVNDFLPGFIASRTPKVSAAPVGGRACPHCPRVIGGTIGALHNHIKTKHADDYPAFLMDHPLTHKAADSRERRAKARAARTAQ
jgi:hypothetical protein